MSWLRALAYSTVGAVLAVVYFATAAPPPPVQPAPRAAPAESAGAPAIDGVRVEVAGRTVAATRSGETWDITEPAGARVPSDLITALISAVLETPAEPIASDGVHVAEFGLDAPTARVTFSRSGAAPVTVSLGAANAAETGVYGWVDGTSQVLLLGLNVRYYVDLVLKQATS